MSDLRTLTTINTANAVAGATVVPAVDALLAAAKAGAATGIVAGIATLTPAALAAIPICIAALYASSKLQAIGAAQGESAHERRFAALLLETRDLKQTLSRIQARQVEAELDDASASKAAGELLAFIGAAERDRRRAESEHRELLVYIGSRLNAQIDQLEEKADALLDGNHAALAKAEEQTAMLREILDKQQELLRRSPPLAAPPFDLQAELDEGVAKSRRADFDGARAIFDQLRRRYWPSLTPHQRMRVLANLACIEDFVGKDCDAVGLFEQAADANPDHPESLSFRSHAARLRGERGQAFAFAEQAVAVHGSVAASWAAWVATAPAERTFQAIEQTVPAALRTVDVVAYSLGIRAQLSGEFDAAVRYHRTARAAGTIPPVTLQLGISLMNAVRSRHSGRYEALSEADRADLSEAVVLLDQGLDENTRFMSKLTQAQVRVTIGIAASMLGNKGRAELEFQTAGVLAPDDPDAVVANCGILFDRHEDDKGIERLRPIVGEGGPDTSTTMLASALRRRARPGDLEEATRLLTSACRQADSTYTLGFRLYLLEALVEACPGPAAIDSVRDVIRALDDETFPPVAKRLAQVTLSVRFGATDDADAEPEEECDDDLTSIGDSIRSLPPEQRAEVEAVAGSLDGVALQGDADRGSLEVHVGEGLYKLRQFDLALAVYKRRFAAATRMSSAAWHMLISADRIGEHRFAVDYCRRMRAHGVVDSGLASFESDILSSCDLFDEALEVIGSALEVVRDPREQASLRLKRSLTAIQLRRPELVERDVNRLPAVEDAGPVVGKLVVQSLIHVGLGDVAAEYAYTLVRRYYAHPAAHESIILAAFPVSVGGAPSKGATWRALPAVTSNCSVRYQIDGSQNDEWVIIEGDSPALDRDERPPGDALARRLVGLRVGDSFHLNDTVVGPRIATIRAIGHPPLGRAMLSCRSFHRLFPDVSPPVEELRMPTGADGELDAKGTVAMLSEMSRRRHEFHEKVFEHADRLPAACTANSLGDPVPKVIGYLAECPKRRLRFSLGTIEEADRARAWAADASTFVLDPTAASVLFHSRAYATIAKFDKAVVVAGSTVRQFERYRDGLLDGQKAVAHEHWDGVSVRFVDNDEAQRELRAKEIAEVETFIAWLRTTTRVEDGLALLDIPAAHRRVLLRGLGKAASMSVALAMRPGHVLWCDDAALAALADQMGLGVRSVWTQWVLSFGFDDRVTHGLLPVERWLALAGFGFTRVTPKLVVAEADRAGWDAADRGLRRVLDGFFGNGANQDEAHLALLADTIIEIVKRSPSIARAQPIMDAFLDRLARDRFGIAVILAFRQGRFALFSAGSDPLAIRLLIEGWLMREFAFVVRARPRRRRRRRVLSWRDRRAALRRGRR